MRPIKTTDGHKSSAFEPCSTREFGSATEWLHVVNLKQGTWHPIDMEKHPEILPAMNRHYQVRSGRSRANTERERFAAQDELDRSKAAFRQACMDAVKTVFEQLESGELASWQPEDEGPAP